MVCLLPLYPESKERQRKAVNRPLWTGRRQVQRARKRTYRLVLGTLGMSRSPHLPASILNVYRKASAGFKLYQASSLNTTLLSQGRALENGCHCGKGGRSVRFKDGVAVGSEEPPIAQLSRSALWSTGGHVLSMTPPPKTPPLLTSAYNLTSPSSAMRSEQSARASAGIKVAHLDAIQLHLEVESTATP